MSTTSNNNNNNNTQSLSSNNTTQSNNTTSLLSSNPSLNFLSYSFNPLLSLYSDINPPIKNVLPRDTIIKDLLPSNDSNFKYIQPNIIKTKPLSKSAIERLKELDRQKYSLDKTKKILNKFNNNFISETNINNEKVNLDNIENDINNTNVGQNIITTTNATEISSQGPFDLLIKYFKLKQRVRIYIRGSHGIRGYCDGYIKAFDRHFNLILNDVYEKYGRFEYQNIDINEIENDINSLYLNDLHEPVKPIANAKKQDPSLTKKSKKKIIWRSRNIRQMFLRGDCVILIGTPPQ